MGTGTQFIIGTPQNRDFRGSDCLVLLAVLVDRDGPANFTIGTLFVIVKFTLEHMWLSNILSSGVRGLSRPCAELARLRAHSNIQQWCSYADLTSRVYDI